MIDSLKDLIEDDIRQLIMMYGEDALKQVSSVLSCIKNIVDAINDMFDVKKNPFINPAGILFVEMTVKRTIKSIINIIHFMCDELSSIKDIIDESKIKEINESTEPIYKIISCIKNIVYTISDMFNVKKNPFINPMSILFVKTVIKETINSIINI